MRNNVYCFLFSFVTIVNTDLGFITDLFSETPYNYISWVRGNIQTRSRIMACIEFKQVLLEVIGETFSSLGDSPKQSIEYHLENTFNLKVSQYPDDVAAFDRALKNIFGPGAILLETLILNRLNEKAVHIQDEGVKQDFYADIRRLNDLWQNNT